MTEPLDAAADNLVVRARTDGEALGRLYERHYAAVLRYCIHRLFRRDVAEDVASEVFLTVARKIPACRAATEREFANWLYAIATRQANAMIRRSRRRRDLLAAAVRQRRIRLADAAEAEDPLDWSGLYEAIASLPRRDQTIVTLRSFERLPFDQIADICDMKTVTARVAFTRALARLRKRLAKAYGRGR